MNYAERRALAAKLLANPELYLKPAKPAEPAEQKEPTKAELNEARLIDRGLIKWWE